MSARRPPGSTARWQGTGGDAAGGQGRAAGPARELLAHGGARAGVSEDGLLLDLGDPATTTGPAPPRRPTDETALYLELDGWEGPLDLLLDLARRQKVDLKAISILALVDQYIGYIERAEALQLELAADYLVMAAWLAYLKSALLLPARRAGGPEPRGPRAAAAAAARAARRDARGGGAADGPRPAGARRVRARRARGPEDRPQDAVAVRLVRAGPGLRPGQRAHRAGGAHGPGPAGDDARFGARPGLGDARGDARLDGNPPVPAARMPSRGCARSALASSFVAALELARIGQGRTGAGGDLRPAAPAPGGR